MTGISKWVGIIAAAAMLSLGACAAEDECQGDRCGTGDRLPPPSSTGNRDAEPFLPCEEVCANVDECGFMDEDDCMTVCRNGGFTNDERACLAVACGDGIGICLDTGRH